jgi:hypothetical protein
MSLPYVVREMTLDINNPESDGAQVNPLLLETNMPSRNVPA